jgi:hypothetical protein
MLYDQKVTQGAIVAKSGNTPPTKLDRNRRGKVTKFWSKVFIQAFLHGRVELGASTGDLHSPRKG